MDKISAGSDRAKVDPCTPLRIIRIMYVHVIRKGGQESDKQLFSVLSQNMVFLADLAVYFSGPF